MTKRKCPGRRVNGILLLDKPAGMTSNAALQRVKRLFRAQKAGHTGSLDPLATGLLPLCFGEATKVSGFLLDAHKYYHVEIALGIQTTTGDAEGTPVATRPVPVLTRDRIEAAMAPLRGEVEQIPPMHSALKHKGKPLYKYAHAGETVPREPRRVTVFEFVLVDYTADRLWVEIYCSKGTYIRTLAEDLGANLGCGAHVVNLRRTRVGPYTDQSAYCLDELEQLARTGPEQLDRRLLTLDSALAHWPEIRVSEELAFFLRRGQAVNIPRAPNKGFVRLLRADNRFFGIGRVLDDGRISPKRLIHL